MNIDIALNVTARWFWKKEKITVVEVVELPQRIDRTDYVFYWSFSIHETIVNQLNMVLVFDLNTKPFEIHIYS